ncbi:MAG TPA: RNA methyltransferase [Caldithrix abyssi]|uniref:tRNA (cytidine/uridine-2'-O-)-methyltransferase TrmJ n=1 Tax=Caldithrix abyssi TaxID=187145 RepID=A0A7V5H2G3_CALAY|nr:RNA methyltransferase [Caldithrix abyssi]
MSQRIPLNEKFKIIRQNLHFILVEPESPGNVGSVARALKTMGFEKLALVNPCQLDNDEARMMAHRSYELIENALIVSDFQQAIKEMRLTVATTMRKRHFKFPFFSPDQVAERLLSAALQHPVAIVFGRESSGLTNEEILKCHLHSTIATATQNPALNLAQAVMIYSYTFFQHLQKAQVDYNYELASQYELERFYEHLAQAIELVQFVPRDGVDNFVTRFRRLIGRSMAEQRDVRLLHKLLQIFETRIQDLEKECGNKPKRNIF